MSAYSFPVKRIGIVGGGQLGRMISAAATKLSCSCVVLCSTPNSPAGQVAERQIVGNLHDPEKLRELAEACDVMTYEIEDIDTETLFQLEKEGHEIHPSPAVLQTIQDKFVQKQAFATNDIATSEFVEVTDFTPEAFAEFGYPLVQKARRGGYDGRGVSIMKGPEDFDKHLPVPSLLERFVKAKKEIAVLVARGKDGKTAVYPPVDMCFTDENILDVLLAPADISQEIADKATELAVKVVDAVNGVGVFGVEMFLTEDNEVLVNEVAPRTHNSGHQTIEANVTDQFEQHLRAVAGLPLGSTEQVAPAAMINLLSEPGFSGRTKIIGLKEALEIPGVCVHLYGKDTTKPHRKMGHVTVVNSTLETAHKKAEQVRDLLKITGEDAL